MTYFKSPCHAYLFVPFNRTVSKGTKEFLTHWEAKRYAREHEYDGYIARILGTMHPQKEGDKHENS